VGLVSDNVFSVSFSIYMHTFLATTTAALAEEPSVVWNIWFSLFAFRNMILTFN